MAESLFIKCRNLPAFNTDDYKTVRDVFQFAEQCIMSQSWLTDAEPGFLPAVVRVGWRDESLLVFAELIDADIFTLAAAHNQRMWKLGDTFEMFLKPVGQQSYAEFHVTPNNLRLQLRYSGEDAIARVRGQIETPEDYLIQGEAFHSVTWLMPDQQKWFVLAEIPATSVCDNFKSLYGSEWRFSFSRYDFTRSHKEPVISSTSPHRQPDLHRQVDWGLLKCVS